MNGKTVLVIDDSETVRATVSDRLERGGYSVASAGNGREGLRRLYEIKPDVVLLDVVMPELDGWKTLQLIRDVSDVPVIMLTSRDTELERVRGLRGGADDYVGKPFSPAELSARIEAVLRRSSEKPEAKEVYDDGTVCIDFASREVTVRGESASLTPLEFRLLAVLTEHTGQVLSRHQLIDLVWGRSYESSGDPVKIYIGYLRKKIERDQKAPELVETVRGFGYRYRRPD
ncbi:MAG TPA: response regulator transcription factor [Gaiellaceae bacterium]